MPVRWKILFLSVLIGLFLVACETGKVDEKTTPALKAPVGHPQLSAEEKLMPCSACHREVTPEIYQEWFNSRHGLANVKCFQCHGTYENFEAEPSVGRCASCHAKEVAHAPKDKKCWACHPVHKFTVHK